MKETVRRAVRTFFQAAAGYLAANIAVTFSGVADGRDTLKSALVIVAASAVACGLAAVMNLPKKNVEENDGK